MSKPMPIDPKALFAAAMMLALSSCGSTPSAKFYLLEPSATTTASTSAAPKTLIVLAPVRIPHYLDRAQIVTASGDNSYQLSELNRWAEGLDYNITRVLQQDLAQLVPATVLQSTPTDTPALKLAITIVEFHVNALGQASLKAQWQVTRSNQILSLQQQNYLQASSSNDYQDRVAALNRCLRQMSEDVAKSLQAAALLP